MTLYAELDGAGAVLRVIVAEQDFIDSQPGIWVKTVFDGSLHKNYAGIGYKFDLLNDGFVPPRPIYPSWVLNTNTCKYEAPVQMPSTGGAYKWDEATQTWILSIAFKRSEKE